MDSLRKRPTTRVTVDLRQFNQQSQSTEQQRHQTLLPPKTSFYQKEEIFLRENETEPKQNQKKNKGSSRFLWKFFAVIIITLILGALAYGAFFLWKSYAIRQKVSLGQPQASFATHVKEMVSTISPSKNSSLNGQQDGRVNILLLGAAGQKDAGKNLTDTIMIMSINTKDNKVGLLSLPRDLYVQIPNTKINTKINTLYQHGLANDTGVEPIKKTVEQITNAPMHYFVVLNYDGFKKIIDAINGINVMVERDIYDTRYPGPNFSYETFALSKGFHTLDGETALKYVRERHTDPQGDFGRAKRQQQVMQSVKNKLFSAQTMLDVVALNTILDAIGDNIKTNIDPGELEGLITLAKKLDTQNINTVVVDAWKKDSLLKVSHVMVGGIRAFILVPRIGNYSEIQETMETLFDHEALEKRKAAIENEKATVEIINASGDSQLARKVRDVLDEKIPFASVYISSASDNNPQEETIIIDHTDGEKLFSADELIKKLPARNASHSDSEGPAKNSFEKLKSDADITVVLGNDLINSYTYEEDSIEDYNNSQDEQLNLLIEQ